MNAYHAIHEAEWADDCPQCDDAWPEEARPAALGGALLLLAFCAGLLLGWAVFRG